MHTKKIALRAAGCLEGQRYGFCVFLLIDYTKDVGALSNDTIEDLVQKIQSGQQPAATMSELYERVRRFIHAVALKYAGKAEIDDLEQEGFLALYPAIDGYDPSRDVKFLSYAGPWINQRMQRYIRCSGLRGVSGLSQMASLDAPLDDTDGATLGDVVPDDRDLEAEVIKDLDSEKGKEILWGCVDQLPGDAPGIIREHFQAEKEFSVIAKETGKSYSHVIATKDSALKKLRHKKDVQDLSDIYSEGLKGNGAGQFRRTHTSSVERIVIRRLDGVE